MTTRSNLIKTPLILLCLSVCGVASGEVSLFDGKTLDGWDGNRAVWRVEEGAITGGSMQGNPNNEFLTTDKRYRNFILNLDYRIVGSDGFVNGGIQFHSERLKDPAYEMIGYQADAGPERSGNLYDESRRRKALVEADKMLVAQIEKPGDWNRFEIRCEGPRIRITLNDRLVADYVEKDPAIPLEGLIALQIHGDNKAIASYRNISIEVLPDDASAEETKHPASSKLGLEAVPGGFSEIEKPDDETLAAAQFAVSARDPNLKLKDIEKIEKQIVAGTNYRLTIMVSDHGKDRRALALVLRKLDGQHVLTSWRWVEGASSDAKK